MGALRYQDTSVLENHHIALGKTIMQEDSKNMFGTLQLAAHNEVSATFTHAILQTDMALHNKMVDQLNQRRDSKMSSVASGIHKDEFDSQDTSERRNVAGVLLHAVDISNPLLPKFELYEVWARRITEEFQSQYKKEQELGLPLTKMWENLGTPVGFYASQIGFVDFLVTPLWNSVLAIFPELQSEANLKDSLEANKAQFMRL